MTAARDQAGFTLPELIVVVILTGFFVTLIFTFLFQYLQNGYIAGASLDTLVSRLNAGDFLRDSIGTSDGLITQNSLPDTHANVADPGIASGYYWRVNHAIPGSFPIGNSGTYTPLLYYRRFSTDTSSNLIMNGVQPYENEYVLYLDGTQKQLLLRTIANSTASNNKATTSCPAAYVTTSCPADKVVARDISSVDLRYFSRTGNTISYTASTDPDTGQYNGPDFPSVEAVELTLHFTVKPLFQKTNAVQSSTVIRIALRNA